MHDNPCYRKGALWRTRAIIKAYPDDDKHEEAKHLYDTVVTIPRGEHVMLLSYYMGKNYEENVIILWDNRTYFVYDIDTGFDFRVDPKGHNTESRG